MPGDRHLRHVVSFSLLCWGAEGSVDAGRDTGESERPGAKSAHQKSPDMCKRGDSKSVSH